jgi:hypothetical protein
MKKLITLMFLFSTLVMAEDLPKVFEDSNIERKLNDGTVQKFDGDKYKIVRRGFKAKPQKTKIVEKTRIVEKTVYKKNEVRLLGGSGPKGIEVNSAPGGVTVDEERGLILGLGYSRMLSHDFSLGADVFNNETVLLELGFHF